ncbi:MAG TPA: tetratricopeptide repeat protein [Gemmatimonadales bacterium]|jgi:tetratricopeptide (TPR) repeat protein|nr:tetratricopeptide repeat protein [Gemmatimonadales bacterium]
MTLQKLKIAARQHEQREEWHAAIDLYRQAIREAEGTSEGGDPALFNRIGDLAHKAGDDAAACDAWEQAASRYGDLGFFNNAIALCGKILRLDPSHLQTYIELARLQARKRVLYEVRLNLHAYLERMNAGGRGDTARGALQKFGEDFPGWRDLDHLLDELLGRERAAEGSRATTAAGPAGGGLVFIDTGPIEIEHVSEPPAAPVELVVESTVIADLEFEPRADVGPLAGFEPTTPDTAEGERIDAAPLSGFQPTLPEEHGAEPADAGTRVEGLIDADRISGDVKFAAPLEGLDNGVMPVVSAEGDRIEGLVQTSLAAPADDDVALDVPEGGADLTFIETDASAPPAELPHADANDPLGQRVLANALLERGDRHAGIAALERALELYQSQSEWLHAYQVAGELIQADPEVIDRHQTRVEIAARMRDPARLCEAYADLGDTLVRSGSTDKAVAVYRRVLEIDDQHPRARAALQAMAPETTRPEGDHGFVDLGAMLIDTGPTSTRMRTEMPDVAPDEQDTFRDALNEFKRALDQNLPIEDHQSHYDLGIAFKEMGLLDEAIGEFQKALRAPEVRLRTSEALGQVFFDQGRPAVAEAVLRGVERGPEGDAEKIGVLYWLGRSLEAQGREADALAFYQRVLAVDVGFHDAADRIAQAGRRSNG